VACVLSDHMKIIDLGWP